MSNAQVSTQVDCPSREWDLTVFFEGDDCVDRGEFLKRLDSTTKAHASYILVGGPERNIQTGLDERDRHSERLHCHVAVIWTEERDRTETLELLFGRSPKFTYCRPRDPSTPYFTWRLHHIKYNTKVKPIEYKIYEQGKLPFDNRLYQFTDYFGNFSRKYKLSDSDNEFWIQKLKESHERHLGWVREKVASNWTKRQKLN